MNLEPKLKIYQEIKDVREIRGLRTLDVAIWPHTGHGNAAKPHFCRIIVKVRGAFAHPIFRRSPPLPFYYKRLQILRPEKMI